MLSPFGRRILIQSMNTSILVYWLGHNSIPGQIIKNLNSINATFLWFGSQTRHGLHPISWDRITHPIPKGGLAICDIHAQSKAQLNQLVWRFIKNHLLTGRSILTQRYLMFRTFRNCNQTPKGFATRKMMNLMKDLIWFAIQIKPMDLDFCIKQYMISKI